ncbi:hypothetical protein B0T18DRAFT_411460 [Schizothecium vesticola]|uniref:Uncharacterized protein n=1 Tax=Schizothecium vesticola TaxID=314040 RepID=A0AA40EVK2_9PEZI|nr:hypothetical protein B0T18DRAFT_411460 [Schizothecium vesticola]
MSSQIFNANGIKVERSSGTLLKGGVTSTIQFIYIWASRKLIMVVREPWTHGSGNVSCGRITIYGDWGISVRQDLNLLRSTTIDGLPPYSELANDTTNAGAVRRRGTTIGTGELTFIRNGITLVTKTIYIAAGEDTLTLSLPLARPARPGLTPEGLDPDCLPSVAICGQWTLNKKYRSWELPVQPTSATTPNIFRRMSTCTAHIRGVWRMTWFNHGIKSVVVKGTGKGAEWRNASMHQCNP